MTDATAVTRLADYRAPDWLISQVALTVTINDGETEIAATLELAQNSADLQPLVLDGEGLETLSVAIDGVILDADAYVVTATTLTVLTPPAGHFTLQTRVRIKPESNTQLEGLYKSGDMYCTQCEAEGFRRITWFLDRPDVLAIWTVRIDAPASMPTLLSNGNRVGDRTTADGRRQVDWSDPHPKPAYLFALVAGDLVLRNDRFTTASGREVDLHVYTRQADADKVDFAIASIKQAMAWARTPVRGASMTWMCSRWLRLATSTWARWRTKGSISSTHPVCWRHRMSPRTTPTSASRRSLDTSTFTTGRAIV